MSVGTPGAIKPASTYAGHLGQGIKYPLVYDSNGRLLLSNGVQSVIDAVSSICQTQLGERVMQPDYGGGAAGVFEPFNAPLIGLALKTAIQDHEARITDLDVDVRLTDTDGKNQIDVTFSVAGEANKFTVTFPYFIGPP